MNVSNKPISAHLALAATAVVLLSVGCGANPSAAESGPSYADLVVIYNAEVQALDRLEKKKADLIAHYEQQLRPGAEEAVQALTDILRSTNPANLENAPEEVLDPYAALDRAVASAEKTQQVTTQVLEAVTQSTTAKDADDPAQQAAAAEFKRQLAELDVEIEKQRARVERARAARDAAEAE